MLDTVSVRLRQWRQSMIRVTGSLLCPNSKSNIGTNLYLHSIKCLVSPFIQSSCPSLTELGKVGNPNALKTCTVPNEIGNSYGRKTAVAVYSCILLNTLGTVGVIIVSLFVCSLVSLST
jgi:hypothetical protein